ncbi:hypothetical protein HUG20_12655 [Salicibibacter cibi]|uniref:Thioredoxin domain-containing protein n=1 Tax=Salicibibacter cibi TaxID=2743001 RepID=A0A7T6ZBX5_9BACI|nr:hypothetical protein [Salicibibacter cibi]QQK80664.1 hypothetical protein HUG20_12655 [Salicibibacter cibi]
MTASKTVFIATIFAIITIASSCNNSDETHTPDAIATTDEPQALLFIDENQPDIERPYYNALINFQNERDEKTDVTIIREQEVAADQCEVEEFPTLMLIHDDEPIAVVSGQQSMEQLVTLLQDNFNER